MADETAPLDKALALIAKHDAEDAAKAAKVKIKKKAKVKKLIKEAIKKAHTPINANQRRLLDKIED
jgi:hypothetical protein